MTPQEIAELAAEAGHDTKRIYCRAVGKDQDLPYVNLAPWARGAVCAVVGAIMANPSIAGEEQHEIWCKIAGVMADLDLTEQYLFREAVKGVLLHFGLFRP